MTYAEEVAQHASDFLAEALPAIRKEMGSEHSDDPIGILRTSSGLIPIKDHDALADVAALALRRLAAQ